MLPRACFGLALLLLLCRPGASQTQQQRDELKADREAFARSVTNLPRPDRVVVSALSARRATESDEPDDLNNGRSHTRLTRVASAELKGREAESLWLLWRGLRNGNGAGCFSPVYLLDFYDGEARTLRTQVCFHCCNVTIPGNGIRSVCGDAAAFEGFKNFLTRALPYPKARPADEQRR